MKMMQRAVKVEKGATTSALKPGQSRFGARSFVVPKIEQQDQAELCGPSCCIFNLTNLPLQAKPESNRNGLPNQLKAGIESLSGMDMSDVRVYANSDKPAQLNALAYTQGTNIHLAPGHEQHLPHEAWHVVQQKLGRVRPTLQAKGVEINDDPGLEREADLMGKKAVGGAPGVISQGIRRLNFLTIGRIDSGSNIIHDGNWVVHGRSTEHLLEAKSSVSSGTAVQRQVVQLLREDEIEELIKFINEESYQMDMTSVPGYRQMIDDLSTKFADGKLKDAKAEARMRLKGIKDSQLSSAAAAAAPAPQSEEKKVGMAEAAEEERKEPRSSNITKAPEVERKEPPEQPKYRQRQRPRYTQVDASKLSFTLPSRSQAPQIETPSESKIVAPQPTIMPSAGHIAGGPKSNARAIDVFNALGISAKHTQLPEIKVQEKPSVPVHLSVPAYDNIGPNEFVAREQILGSMHITVELHGKNHPHNPRFWLKVGSFKGDELTHKPQKAIRELANEFLQRLDSILT